jgi:2-polyprenyl-3-methyl-5-hydroxy-6-metoxy-1,4-benzoquinol methylase
MSTKAVQGKLWSSSPSYWANHFEPYFLPIYRKVFEKVDISDDTSLLDAGCGSGLFSTLAIKAGAHVTGVDAAPGLLEIARKEIRIIFFWRRTSKHYLLRRRPLM